jgi:hypothetical protein
MSSKKHRKKLKQFHRTRKAVLNVIKGAEDFKGQMKSLAKLALTATVNLDNLNKNIYEYSSNNYRNSGSFQL